MHRLLRDINNSDNPRENNNNSPGSGTMVCGEDLNFRLSTRVPHRILKYPSKVISEIPVAEVNEIG